MAFCTAASASALTAVDPFTTRDTVERETPATAATSSIVERGISPGLVGRGSDRSGCDDASVLPAALLDRALLRLVVDAHDAEALGVAPRAFVVVHERPVEVAAHVGTLLDGIQRRRDVVAQELGAIGIGHLAVRADLVGVGDTVLGDVQRPTGCVLLD